MAHDHCSDERLNAEGEVAVARLIIDGGDLTHALRHIADSLAMDPQLPDAHEVLAEFVSRAGGPEVALKHFEAVEGQGFTGTVAAHAHVCAMAGRWDDAVQMLFNVAAYEPQRTWLDVAWLRPDLPVSPELMASAVARLASHLDDPVDEDERAPLLPALEVLRGTVARNPRHAALLWSGSMLARRLGAFDEAVAWTDRSFALEPSHYAAVMKGYALRTAGRLEEALAAWIQEAQRTPDELSVYLDVSDLLADMERFPEALAWAQRVVAREPGNEKAVATVHGLQYAITEDVRHLVALADDVRAQPDNTYSAVVLGRYSHQRPWLGQVAQATESVINVMQQVLENTEPGPEAALAMTVSALEPPSAMMTLRRVYPSIEVTVGSIPEPDLRVTAHPVRTYVWQFDGTEARPAGPPPSQEASEAVRHVAQFRWRSIPDAYDSAVVLSSAAPHDLLAVLVHPPVPPDDELGRALARHAPHLWIRAVQAWACLGLAHHRSDEPWPTSYRRGVLIDLLNGPEDWVCEAAAFALVVTAWVDPATRRDVQELVARRMFDAAQAYRTREVTILESLCRLVLAVPDVVDEVASLARDLIANKQA
ncbi:tetratricopeptide repeat protein [Actinocrispum wychmicini]|uniref:Tfp pilus assembly protein PilF n=1 Tax=Actinocrispum wychmicini TaxID=1213861 RepID=A0A4R2J919_9PSEU|nr:tetratricopeptide repeat protein [Actinocrispum wychmicini]TCO52349.1 Tfp pilus assembly protein PilF [Actinocrispum wychmicini]